jgi:hypothetical protein
LYVITKIKKGGIMEWLIVIGDFFVTILKWSFMLGFYLCAFVFAIVTAVLLWIAYDERKIYKGKDYGWKLFPLLAIITGIFSGIFVFLGNLFI